MDDKLNELKEKQAQIGDKISLLQQTNKRKDEEAAEIRQLIQECRENLNRIKGLPGAANEPLPCLDTDFDNTGWKGANEPNSNERQRTRPNSNELQRTRPNSNELQRNRANSKELERNRANSNELERNRPNSNELERNRPNSNELERNRPNSNELERNRPNSNELERNRPNSNEFQQNRPNSNELERNLPNSNDYAVQQRNHSSVIKFPCGSRDAEKRRCEELLGKKEKKRDSLSKKKNNKERVSCRVDLNKMKIRVRGPSEDLKKLDATQLINLLEKCQCQELIINTGDQITQDPGQIRLIYFMHPGNIVMAAGVIMLAFLINTNVCHEENSCSKQLILNVLYVGSFAFHFGMVLWMVFIRGYALRFGLNHDMFHVVDNLILPKYYSVCVLLDAMTLYSLLAMQCVTPCSSWPIDVVIQIIIVVMTFLLELITICYVIPALIKLRDATDDYIFDDEEPDCCVPQSFQKNLIMLGKLGWIVFLINFLTFIFLGANIYYITSKLNLGSAN